MPSTRLDYLGITRSYRDTRLDYRDGALCVRWAMSQSSEPIMTVQWFPIHYTRRDTYADLIGLHAEWRGDGRYSVYAPGGFWMDFGTIDGAKTASIAVENLPIPCPKVRAGIETRYRDGRWQKYLKTRGWIDA